MSCEFMLVITSPILRSAFEIGESFAMSTTKTPLSKSVCSLNFASSASQANTPKYTCSKSLFGITLAITLIAVSMGIAKPMPSASDAFKEFMQ